MEKDVFDYIGYKRYLLDRLEGKTGIRSQIAKALQCQVSYVSQVLNKDGHFSPEQAEALNEFLGHTQEEGDFFLLLLQVERAGSVKLRKRLKSQIDNFRRQRLVLKNRVDIKQSLSKENQAIYYSNWQYSAVHILVTVPAFQDRDRIADYLSIQPDRLSEILEFLFATGLVKQEKGKLLPGEARLFLGEDVPMLRQHHTNWRVRAIESLDRKKDEDVHFSGVFSLSREDVLKLKEKIVKEIESSRALVRASAPEEEVHVLCVDLFQL